MSTAIQKHEPSALDTLYDTKWPRSVVDVVRKQKCPKGISDEEFFVFLMQCKQSGLNPLLGHAYCVPRRTKVSAKGQPDQWMTVHVFQPAIDGMRARAAEFPDFVASDSAAVYEKDLVTIDKGTGAISHKTNPAGQRGRLVSSWGRVRKKDGTAVVVELPVGARSGDSTFWSADPGGMLSKCAEAAALRKAYPVALAGVYVAEELPSETQAPTRAEVVLGAASGGPPTRETPALPAAGPVVEFGEWKGQPIAALRPEEKDAALKYAEWQLEQNPKMKAKIREALTTNMDAIRASMTVKPEAEDVEEVPPASHRLTDEHAEPPPGMALGEEPGDEG